MEKIKVEINKLQKILADMKKRYNDYAEKQLDKYYGELAKDFELYIDNETKDNIALKEEIYKYFVTKSNQKDNLSIVIDDNPQVQLFLINFVKNYQSILDVVINLNKLLDKPIKKIQSLEEVQHKKLLSVKEVEALHGFSKTQQQGFRGRLTNSLPYHKQTDSLKNHNAKIYYKRNEIEDWIDNCL